MILNMENISIRFYLKELRKKIKFINSKGELNIVPPPSVLRKTSLAIDCQLQDPSHSINCLCQMNFDSENNIYNVKVFDYVYMIEDEDRKNKKEWINVNWKIDKFQKNIKYHITSYFSPPMECLEPIDKYYVLCRSQFCPILIFFILKLKVKYLRLKKKNYLIQKFCDIGLNIFNLIPSIPYKI